ncbi:MAG: type IV pilus twitching motility protein PilT [Oscillospiraceae bacterium]|nr:type IV pilus twitching motility protein PilT [Oscillospiraceae bacterium]
MDINTLIEIARRQRASDIHITAARNPVFRIDGTLIETDFALNMEEKKNLLYSMMNQAQTEKFDSGRDVDMAYSTPSGDRQRVNIYRQQEFMTAAIRIINTKTPTFDELKLPETLRQLTAQPRGLVLITGPTGSGKSTTLAAMIDHINKTRACHILTIEDPVEYVYTQDKSFIHQRDVGVDIDSFSSALRSAMREDPDVILVGEMRDYETVSAAITAAETGHLVLSTLHTTGAAATIDRIIDVFPPHNQQQIRTQLASTLKGVITQTLLPRAAGAGRVAAFEIMLGSDAILNLIREVKGHQINSTIQMSAKQGMVLLDTYLANLVRSGTVSMEAAKERANDVSEFMSAVTRV